MIEMLDKEIVTTFEEIEQRRKAAEFAEAQLVYANAAARFSLNPADVEANRECERARKRLFNLFIDGYEDVSWLLKAWNQYRRRLCYHHKQES